MTINCWTLAEAAGHASPYRMQHLLSRARVDGRQLLDAAADRAADEERRELAGVPDEVMLATKPQLAGDLLQHARDLRVPRRGRRLAARRRQQRSRPRTDSRHRA
jgi:hypothetical protein